MPKICSFRRLFDDVKNAKTFSQKIEHTDGVMFLPLTLLFSYVTFHLNSGKYDTIDLKLSFGNDALTTLNFQVRDFDLQAMGGGMDVTEKNFGPIPIIRPYMNPIHPRVWK